MIRMLDDWIGTEVAVCERDGKDWSKGGGVVLSSGDMPKLTCTKEQ